MSTNVATAVGTSEQPWTLKTPSRTSEYIAYRDDTLDPPVLGHPRRTDRTALRRALHRRSAQDAQRTRELGSARQLRRTEAAGRGHRRSLGALLEEPARRLVRAEERPARPLRDVRPPDSRGARPGRDGAPPQEQPHPRVVAFRAGRREERGDLP